MATRAQRQRVIDEQDERRVNVGLIPPEFPMASFGVELIAPLRWVRGAGMILAALGGLAVMLALLELAGLPIMELGPLVQPALILGGLQVLLSLPLIFIKRRPWYPLVLYVTLGFMSLPLVTLLITVPLILLVSKREVQAWFALHDELKKVFV